MFNFNLLHIKSSIILWRQGFRAMLRRPWRTMVYSMHGVSYHVCDKNDHLDSYYFYQNEELLLRAKALVDGEEEKDCITIDDKILDLLKMYERAKELVKDMDMTEEELDMFLFGDDEDYVLEEEI